MVHWMMEDDADSVWLYLACGLVRIARAEFDAWASDPKQQIRTTVFDSSDGVRNLGLEFGYSSVVAKSSDGKTVVLAFWRRQRHRSASSCVQHTVRHRCTFEQIVADRRDVRRDALVAASTARARSPDRLHGAQPRRAGEEPVPHQARRARQRLAGRRHAATSVLYRPRSRHLPLPRRREQQQRRVERGGRGAGFLDRAGVLPDALVPGARGRRRVRCSLWAGYRARVRQVARAVSSDGSTNASTSARASRGNCTTRCFRASTVCCCDSRPPCTCCRIARQKRKSNWMVRLNTRRRRSPKAVTRSRACARRPSNVTISRSRSGPLATSSRPTRAPTSRPHSVLQSRAETRDLHPIVRDEIYKIAAEALRNAFRHAHAGRVEVEIRYDDEQFRIARARRWQGDRSGGARKPGSRGTLRPARHARTCCTDRRETGGVERSRRRDGGGAAPSCPHRLRDIPEALLVVTAVGLQDAGTKNDETVLEFATRS